jgi:hypothetical protein
LERNVLLSSPIGAAAGSLFFIYYALIRIEYSKFVRLRPANDLQELHDLFFRFLLQ